MTRWLRLMIWALVMYAPALTATEDGENAAWPRWRGIDFNGTSRETGVFPPEGFALEVRWRTTLGSGYSGVVVSDEHVITMFSDGDADFVVSLGADGGRERWRFPIGPTFPGREGANDGPVSTPAISDGVVIALGPRGDLVAIELESGALRWKRHLVDDFDSPRPHWGFSTSPLISGGRVFVETGGRDGALTAFDAMTGETLWSAGTDEVNYQSPVLWRREDTVQLVAAGDRTLFAVDPTNGRELWRYEHGSSAFFRRILNPVLVGSDSIFFTSSPDGSTLIGLTSGENGEVAIEERWRTPHVKRNYATPIAHQGHIYGFSRNFLTSVDADSGALNWKSRPPGNGFHILVDGHLVILTKQGSLHVAEASPEAYRERARLDVVPRITWTPPAFANGRIYLRDSFADVVAVDVVQIGDATDTEEFANVEGFIPGTEFETWLASLAEIADLQTRRDAITDYLDGQKRIPIVENDRIAHFVYLADDPLTNDVAIHGGMLGAHREISMRRVEGTGLFFASFEFESDARIQYQFVRDLDTLETDPLNPRSADSFLYPGDVSILVMPQAEPLSNDDREKADAARNGTLEPLPFATDEIEVGRLTWGGERPVHVYLPEGYDLQGPKAYPSVYILYGRQMREVARLDRVLDELSRGPHGVIEPVIAVFVDSTSGYEYARSQREAHAKMLVDQLIPLVDKRYHTRTAPESRAIVGVYEGGFAAIEIALRYPGTFHKVGIQSPLAIGIGGEELLRVMATSEPQPLSIYLDWGRYDFTNDATETDIPGFSRRLREGLLSRGYAVFGREWSDSSDTVIWGARAPAMFEALFTEGGDTPNP